LGSDGLREWYYLVPSIHGSDGVPSARGLTRVLTDSRRAYPHPPRSDPIRVEASVVLHLMVLHLMVLQMGCL